MKQMVKKIVSIISVAALSASLFVTAYANDQTVLAAMNEATADTIATAIADYRTNAGKTDAYSVLPSYDVEAINQMMLSGAPYADYAALEAAYTNALKSVTGADEDSYKIAWQEDFSKGLDESVWTVTGTLKGNSVGTTTVSGLPDIARQHLDINGEQASAAFFGGSFVNQAQNHITRAVENPKSIITLYFYDVCKETSQPRFNVRVNDKCAILRTDNSNYYGYEIDGTSKKSTVPATVGWHKVVFDAITNDGLVTAYLDGVELWQSANPIEYLSVGNKWGGTGWDIFWVDQITVVEEKSAERIKVMNKGTELTDTLPSGVSSITVQVENPEFKTDYIIVTYAGEDIIDTVYVMTKDDLKEATAKKITITDITEMNIFQWDGIDTMKPVGDVINLKK